MEQTLHALSGILLKAIPTSFLFLVLFFYLKAMFFKPLAKVLKEREELTAGARKSAAQSLAEADQKTREYEAKFNEARTEVYRDQEETRKQWLSDQAAQTAATQAASAEKVAAAKQSIADESAAAKKTLVDTSATLAERIASTVLARKAS